MEWKAQGLTYAEIAARGGGILHTVRATREASEADLVRIGLDRLLTFVSFGTPTVEVKSGYGLRTADELKMLSAAAEAGRPVVATLLPLTSFYLGEAHYAPARRLVEAGVPVAVGTDFNPGTSPSPRAPSAPTEPLPSSSARGPAAGEATRLAAPGRDTARPPAKAYSVRKDPAAESWPSGSASA